MNKLRQQADVVNDIWGKAYDHFRARLNERYGLDISFKEYVLLTKERVDKESVSSGNKCAGWITIRGQRVLVAKEMKRHRFLSTALLPTATLKACIAETKPKQTMETKKNKR